MREAAGPDNITRVMRKHAADRSTVTILTGTSVQAVKVPNSIVSNRITTQLALILSRIVMSTLSLSMVAVPQLNLQIVCRQSWIVISSFLRQSARSKINIHLIWTCRTSLHKFRAQTRQFFLSVLVCESRDPLFLILKRKQMT